MVTRVRCHTRPWLAAAFAAALFLSLPAPARAGWDPIPPQAWSEPPRPDSGGTDAILLLETSECRQKDTGFELDYFARAKVFTADGRAVGNVEILYIKKSWKLTNLRARAVRPNGEAVELDPATVVTTTAWKYRDYEVLRASVAVPGVEPGCVVEWAYTISGPRGYWTGWRFRFANDFYTCRSTHVWKVPDGIWQAVRPAVRYANVFASRVEETFEPSRDKPRTMTFTIRGLAGARDEAFAPPSADAGPRVDVYVQSIGAEPTTHWSEWKHVFDVYQTELGKTPGKLADLVAGFRSGAADDLAALRAGFAWVQANYTSHDELGWARRAEVERIEKSYRYSETLKELLDRREASPFEINVLMVAIARKLGFRASVGMVGDREFERFESRGMGFPPENFITVVWTPGDVLYLQPNSRFALFGSIPWNLRGGDCLLSGESSDLFFRISPDAGLPTRAAWTVALDLSPDGAIDGHISARLAGEACGDWKRALWQVDPERWPTYVEERLAKSDGPKAKAQPVAIGAPGDTLLTLDASAHWPSVATVVEDRIEIPFDRLAPWRTRARFLLPRRTRSVLLPYACNEALRVQLKLPPGSAPEQLPAPLEFRNELGTWSLRWSFAGGVVTVDREVALAHAEVPIKGYPLVREFFDSLEHADETVLLVAKGK